MSRRVVWGEPRLFVAADDRAETRFRVRVEGGFYGPVLASLALATAQARAAALDGRCVEIASIDGTVASVQRWGDRLVVASSGPASWPLRCERLLAEHGSKDHYR